MIGKILVGRSSKRQVKNLQPPARLSCNSLRRARRAGAATIEFALVAPFILLLVFGSVEFFRVMMVKQSLTNAAREGCRTAILATTQSDSVAESMTRSHLRGVIGNIDDQDIVRVSISPSFSGLLNTGTEITASVEVDCADVSWLPAMFLAGAKVRGSATMNRE